MVPENFQTPTTEGHNGNSKEEGVLKAKLFKGKNEPTLEFPEGREFKPKTVCGGVWIFSGTTCFKIKSMS